MAQVLLVMILALEQSTSAGACSVPRAAFDAPVRSSAEASSSLLSCLALDAYAKAERAGRRWQAARLAGDRAATERARRLMLRHQAIAYCLDPGRRMRHEPA